MPLFARSRGQSGVHSVLQLQVTCSVLVSLLVLAFSSLQSACVWRDWKSSASLFFEGTESLLTISLPKLVVWKDLYEMGEREKGSSSLKFKPRVWPHDYENIPGNINVPQVQHIARLPNGETKNVTFHVRKEFDPSCQPRSDWHSFSFPTCNEFHTLDMQAGLVAAASDIQADKSGEFRVKYGFAGASRESWLIESSMCTNGGHYCDGKTILRSLRWREVYDELIYDKQRIDAIVSERLTSSPHVIDIYGFCGASALNEYADGGMFAKTFRHKYSDSGGYTDRELLVFARDAALSLAAIHEIDGRGNVTSVVHHDLRAENFLTTNGTLKVADFNNGQLLRWDFDKNTSCYGFDWSGGCGQSMEQTNRKAPEECLDVENRTLTTEKVEVYRFGAFLYYLISKGNWTYSCEQLPDGNLGRPAPGKVKKLILSGKGPSLPPFVKESNSTDIKAIVHAMRMAHTFDSRKRPSTREIADHLEKATRTKASHSHRLM